MLRSTTLSRAAHSLAAAAGIARPKLAVIGGGQMGNGIAIVATRALEQPVWVLDTSLTQLNRASEFAAAWAEKEVSKGRMAAVQRDDFIGRLRFQCVNGSPEEVRAAGILSDAKFVIEAVIENESVKKKVIREMFALHGLNESSIVATNTSSLSITTLAAEAPTAGKVIGMHFMNPVPVMPLVEIIRGLHTSDETLESTKQLCAALGKTTGTSEDRPGFISNRILMPMINEAFTCLENHVGTAEDIDKIMKLGTNVPMGPLTLGDFIGLDTCLAIMDVLHRETGDSKYRPSVLLRHYVSSGKLGRKTNQGVYKY